MTGPRIDSYDWPGGREPMLRFGPELAPTVILALPLFDEANRTRRLGVSVLRLLAANGIAGSLPELPGQGDSLLPTDRATLAALREAYASAVKAIGGGVFALGIRSGALLDGASRVAGRYHLAPVTGQEVLRDQWRLARAGMPRGQPSAFDAAALIDGKGASVTIAGNEIARALFAELRDAALAGGSPTRVARLASDPRDADVTLPGMPLWRRAEPGDDPALAAALADDIAAWVRRCAG